MNLNYLQSNLRVAFWKSFRRFWGGPVKITLDDIPVNFSTDSSLEYQRCKSLGGEKAIIRDILAQLDSDDVFYDIGANIGTHACFVGHFLEQHNLIAFEPFPANTNKLRENFDLNDIEALVEERALSDRNGTIPLHMSGKSAGEGGNSLIDRGEAVDEIQVETVTGDTFVYEEGHPVPNVMKIDVEGAERQVLQGMKEVLRDPACQTVYYESHTDGDDVSDLLQSAGFTLERLQVRNSEIHYRAKKSS